MDHEEPGRHGADPSGMDLPSHPPRRIDVSVPELAFVAATRGMIGAGLGLLLADRLGKEQRKAVGWTLLAIGAATTVPIAVRVFGRR